MRLPGGGGSADPAAPAPCSTPILPPCSSTTPNSRHHVNQIVGVAGAGQAMISPAGSG